VGRALADQRLWAESLKRHPTPFLSLSLSLSLSLPPAGAPARARQDPEKRKIYDQYGEDAIREGMSDHGGSSMADIFDMFGGGGGGRRGRERKAEDVMHRLKVSLEEMYNGGTRKLAMSRNIKCTSCSGTGSKSGAPSTCMQCSGAGVEVHMRPIGPGMLQQVQQACRKCDGSGRNIARGDECEACGSKGFVPEKKVFEVAIEKGMKNGQRIVLHGEAGVGSDPSQAPGDVVFQLEQKPHDVFKRVGQDLFMDKEIPLVDALCGGSIMLTQLDGRKLVTKPDPSHTIQPDQWVCIGDEGMPLHGMPFEKGNLYVRFIVEFPDQLDPEQAAKIAALLPGPPGPSATELQNAEECTTRTCDIQEELKRRGREHQSGAENSDSDDEGAGPRVQCAQQ